MTIADQYALLVAEHAELVAAARAAVAGQRLGEDDPLIHVRHVLNRHGQLPPKGARPMALLSRPMIPSASSEAGGYPASLNREEPLPSPARGVPALGPVPTRPCYP